MEKKRLGHVISVGVLIITSILIIIATATPNWREGSLHGIHNGTRVVLKASSGLWQACWELNDEEQECKAVHGHGKRTNLPGYKPVDVTAGLLAAAIVATIFATVKIFVFPVTSILQISAGILCLIGIGMYMHQDANKTMALPYPGMEGVSQSSHLGFSFYLATISGALVFLNGAFLAGLAATMRCSAKPVVPWNIERPYTVLT